MSTQKTPRMITFNHYTSRKGLRAILKSEVIQESKIRQNDATFGDGETTIHSLFPFVSSVVIPWSYVYK